MRFMFGAGRLCLDFTRTVRERRGATTEGLALPADLARWAQEAHLPVRLAGKRLTKADVESARQLREAVYSVVRARVAGKTPDADAIELLNAHAAHAPPVPHLLQDGTALEWAAANPLRAVLALIARDAVELVTSPLIGRVRECADPRCTSLFLDTSRPGKRRWCSAMPCANRQKVRAYRARRGAEPPDRER
ncbi:MAG TPA: ABATE domain-containing protein [Gemmatimonadaceae bacterium]|nr:ABATE domain-containing protein [Gemmatimonadaceae bacterium]